MISHALVVAPSCVGCEQNLAELEQARANIVQLEQRVIELDAECMQLRTQLHEAAKLIKLQEADLERYKKAYETCRPNHPERVPREQLQLAFTRVLEFLGLADNDTTAPSSPETSAESPDSDVTPQPPHSETEDPNASEDTDDQQPNPGGQSKPPKRRHPHGRRRLNLTNLPVEKAELEPAEVIAAGGKGYRYIGDEVSERIAYRPASYIRFQLIRRKYVPIEESWAESATGDPEVPTEDSSVSGSADPETMPRLVTPVLMAPLPEGVWVRVMADPSAVAHHITSKYSDGLPLNRQETISAREGFVIPRSTQCCWLTVAYPICEQVVDAMFTESRDKAFCIATDATGARVRAEGKCERWHVFVFIADRDHIVFEYSPEHSSLTIASMLEGFHGHLLADAAPIYDLLYREHDLIEVCCWSHARRRFYRALETHRELALEPLALISKLFQVERECRALNLDLAEFTETRAQRAQPILNWLDQWVAAHADTVDLRSPLDEAIGYYENQRDALHRFLQDGRLRLDNGISEQALRHLVLGMHTWLFFENETGLRWYTAFRSLIASCALHKLNCQQYLEELLRLGPHWPKDRMIELAPKYWKQTRERLDPRQRMIITRPWERAGPASPGELIAAPQAPIALTG
ncbi:IS66 family transposase [Myxococcota bacterium]